MKYQKKKKKLLNNTSNQPSKFRLKIGLKQMMNQEEHTNLIAKSNSKLQC